MKTATLIGLFVLVAALLGGCGLIPGFSTKEAQAIAEKRQQELQPVADRLTQIEAAVIEARDAYEEAQRKGDEKAIQEAGQVLLARLGQLDLAKDDWDNAQNAFKSAVKDFQDAKSTADYLEFFVGSLGGILGMFGIGVPMVKRRNDALAITAASIDTALDDKSAGAFKAAQVDAFKSNPGALKALNKARGK